MESLPTLIVVVLTVAHYVKETRWRAKVNRRLDSIEKEINNLKRAA